VAAGRLSVERALPLSAIYIALGANIPSPAGPPSVTLKRALEAMAKRGIEVVAVSRFYGTASWPKGDQPDFVNAVAKVWTKLAPGELLRELLLIERSFGRVRKTKWEPRSLDLDLVDYGGLISDAPHLMLPHPLMHERAFVLRPLADVAPGWRHPDTGQDVGELLRIVGDEGVRPLEEA
jgi:2-amino-4-hydroxy-6-hydroxymethyldihydropteridine diphosphokinase